MIAAVVPAAGHSQRMGRPKLILPLGGMTVIARVVAALREAGVSPVVVVSPPENAPGAPALGREATAAGARVVVPSEQPVDMRASVELALSALEGNGEPPGWILLTPADCPGLTPSLVARVIKQARATPSAVVVPTFGGRRGHPVAIPWAIAVTVRNLPDGVGVNALLGLQAASLVEMEVDDPAAVEDLDTPEDYQRWTGVADESL